MENAMKELLPAKLRLWVYLVVGLLLLFASAWQVAEGNAVVAILTFFGTLQSLLSAVNTRDAPAPLTDAQVLDLAQERGKTVVDYHEYLRLKALDKQAG